MLYGKSTSKEHSTKKFMCIHPEGFRKAVKIFLYMKALDDDTIIYRE